MVRHISGLADLHWILGMSSV